MGRHPVWEDPEAFDEEVDSYFEDETQYPHTWTGLARYLGFESRQSLEDYKIKDGFSYPIKKALLRIEEIYEKALFNKNAAGPIFALKNFGWRDRTEVKNEHSGEVGMIFKGMNYIKPNDPGAEDQPGANT